MNSAAPQLSLTKIRKLGDWRLADSFFCFAVTAVLWFRFFRFPAIPIAPATGDQAIFLLGATRMLEGQVIYRDFFQFITPGTEFLYFALIKIFGRTASLPSVVILGVALAFTILGLRISRKVLSDWRVYLGPLLFLTAGFLPSPDATHHVFSTLAILLALDLLLIEIDKGESDPKLQLAAGALCAVSCFFTPTRGVIVLFVLCLVTLSHQFSIPGESASRRSLNLSIGFLAGVIASLGPTIWLSGFHSFYDCVVEFALRNARAMPANDLRSYATDLPILGFGARTTNTLSDPSGLVALMKWSLIYLISPGIYFLCAANLWRNKKEAFTTHQRKLFLIAATGCALFLSVAYAPIHFRMGIVSMPATILTAWFLRSERILSRALSLFLAIFAAVVAPAGILHSQRNESMVLRTPAGQLAIRDAKFDSAAEKYSWLKIHTQPGDFLFSQNPEYYYLFHLRHPGPLPFLTVYDYTTVAQVEQTVAGIERHQVKYILWPNELQSSTRLSEGGPPEEDHLNPLRELLHKQFRLVHVFSDSDEVWQRRSPDTELRESRD